MKQTIHQRAIELCKDHIYFGGMHLTYCLLLIPGEVMHYYSIRVSLDEETCEAQAGNDLARALEHYQRVRDGIVTPCGLDDVMQELQYA